MLELGRVKNLKSAKEYVKARGWRLPKPGCELLSGWFGEANHGAFYLVNASGKLQLKRFIRCKYAESCAEWHFYNGKTRKWCYLSGKVVEDGHIY